VQWLTRLPLDLGFAGSNSDEDDEFLRATKIRSTTSFGREVKPLIPCCQILRRVREPYEYEMTYFVDKIHGHSSSRFSYFATRWLLVNARALVDESGMVRTHKGTQKWSPSMGRLARYHSVTVNFVLSSSIWFEQLTTCFCAVTRF
jgi:hypothetical protein